MSSRVPKVLVPITRDTEEMEAVIIVDVLRRAGWGVTVAGMDPGPVTASRGVKILPDLHWDEAVPASFDALVIPGGKGVRSLAKDRRILDAAREFDKAGKWIGAICAGPLVLRAAGLLEGRRVTCHPSVAAELGIQWQRNDRVVVDGRLVTSQGPGTALEFAVTLIRLIEGPESATKVAAPLILHPAAGI
jgi:4-methyl-5(b-hydroxyethyl)-thiazole monophosphate biosynthesis